MIIKNGNVITAKEIKKCDIKILNGKIAELGFFESCEAVRQRNFGYINAFVTNYARLPFFVGVSFVFKCAVVFVWPKKAGQTFYDLCNLHRCNLFTYRVAYYRCSAR